MNLKKSSLAPGETISSTVAPPAQGWPGRAGGPVAPAPTCPAVPVSPGWARVAGGSEKGCMTPWPPKTPHQGEPGTCGFWGPQCDLSQWQTCSLASVLSGTRYLPPAPCPPPGLPSVYLLGLRGEGPCPCPMGAEMGPSDHWRPGWWPDTRGQWPDPTLTDVRMAWM